jgi:hypothetical protein
MDQDADGRSLMSLFRIGKMAYIETSRMPLVIPLVYPYTSGEFACQLSFRKGN